MAILVREVMEKADTIEEAVEIIQTASLALKLGLTVEDLRKTIFPYLTNVEGIKLATLAFEKDVAMLSCCAS